MAKNTETKNCSGVDKGLVAMFLKMSPEERLQANDNATRQPNKMIEQRHFEKSFAVIKYFNIYYVLRIVRVRL